MNTHIVIIDGVEYAPVTQKSEETATKLARRALDKARTTAFDCCASDIHDGYHFNRPVKNWQDAAARAIILSLGDRKGFEFLCDKTIRTDLRKEIISTITEIINKAPNLFIEVNEISLAPGETATVKYENGWPRVRK